MIANGRDVINVSPDAIRSAIKLLLKNSECVHEMKIILAFPLFFHALRFLALISHDHSWGWQKNVYARLCVATFCGRK